MARWRMFHFQWAVAQAIAILGLVAPGYPMARVAVVRIAVAEPERYRAAPSALEVDVLGAVLVAVSDSCAYKRR